MGFLSFKLKLMLVATFRSKMESLLRWTLKPKLEKADLALVLKSRGGTAIKEWRTHLRYHVKVRDNDFVLIVSCYFCVLCIFFLIKRYFEGLSLNRVIIILFASWYLSQHKQVIVIQRQPRPINDVILTASSIFSSYWENFQQLYIKNASSALVAVRAETKASFPVVSQSV